MNWNALKNFFLGLFGVAVIAIVITVASYFDEEIGEDKFLLGYMSITWAIYIICKINTENHRKRN